jgi:aerobic-type carbon monoxide dehydrogenase small subunit (CoxS/CutS family)
MNNVTVSMKVNGRACTAQMEPRTLLSDCLRHEFGLPGTHVGCEHGVCGSCTVLVDGRTARSCLMFAVQAEDAAVTTIEGLAQDGVLNHLQEAFWEEHGLQCGYCTPGMLMAATELLAHNANPSDDDIREAISGNLCRCTGYTYIINAVRSAAAKMRAAPAPKLAA